MWSAAVNPAQLSGFNWEGTFPNAQGAVASDAQQKIVAWIRATLYPVIVRGPDMAGAQYRMKQALISFTGRVEVGGNNAREVL
jgi:hypothetical protein